MEAYITGAMMTMDAGLAARQEQQAALRQRRRDLHAAFERTAQEYREGAITAEQRVTVQREIMRELREIARETSAIALASAISRLEKRAG